MGVVSCADRGAIQRGNEGSRAALGAIDGRCRPGFLRSAQSVVAGTFGRAQASGLVALVTGGVLVALVASCCLWVGSLSPNTPQSSSPAPQQPLAAAAPWIRRRALRAAIRCPTLCGHANALPSAAALPNPAAYHVGSRSMDALHGPRTPKAAGTAVRARCRAVPRRPGDPRDRRERVRWVPIPEELQGRGGPHQPQQVGRRRVRGGQGAAGRGWTAWCARVGSYQAPGSATRRGFGGGRAAQRTGVSARAARQRQRELEREVAQLSALHDVAVYENRVELLTTMHREPCPAWVWSDVAVAPDPPPPSDASPHTADVLARRASTIPV